MLCPPQLVFLRLIFRVTHTAFERSRPTLSFRFTPVKSGCSSSGSNIHPAALPSHWEFCHVPFHGCDDYPVRS